MKTELNVALRAVTIDTEDGPLDAVQVLLNGVVLGTVDADSRPARPYMEDELGDFYHPDDVTDRAVDAPNIADVFAAFQTCQGDNLRATQKAPDILKIEAGFQAAREKLRLALGPLAAHIDWSEPNRRQRSE